MPRGVNGDKLLPVIQKGRRRAASDLLVSLVGTTGFEPAASRSRKSSSGQRLLYRSGHQVFFRYLNCGFVSTHRFRRVLPLLSLDGHLWPVCGQSKPRFVATPKRPNRWKDAAYEAHEALEPLRKTARARTSSWSAATTVMASCQTSRASSRMTTTRVGVGGRWSLVSRCCKR